MAKKLSFGEFIMAKRKALGITQKQIADSLGITAVYICDIEKDRRYPPTNGELLPKIVEILKLNNEDSSIFYDLAGFGKNCVSPDLAEYIMSSPVIRTALRIAKNKATGDDWQKFIKALEIQQV